MHTVLATKVRLSLIVMEVIKKVITNLYCLKYLKMKKHFYVHAGLLKMLRTAMVLIKKIAYQ